MYMIQEQISRFLQIKLKTFCKNYPHVKRRRIDDVEERNFLREYKGITDTDINLGLSAIASEDVCKLCFSILFLYLKTFVCKSISYSALNKYYIGISIIGMHMRYDEYK